MEYVKCISSLDIIICKIEIINNNTEWYDNNESLYRPMGLIVSDDGKIDEKEKPDEDLLDQLEASFLGNLCENFDPQQFDFLNSVKFALIA